MYDKLNRDWPMMHCFGLVSYIETPCCSFKRFNRTYETHNYMTSFLRYCDMDSGSNFPEVFRIIQWVMSHESGWNPWSCSTVFLGGTGILSLRMLRYFESSKRTWPMVMKFIWAGNLIHPQALLWWFPGGFIFVKRNLIVEPICVYLPRASTMKAFSIFPHRKNWDFSANNCLHGGVCFKSPWSCFNTSSIELRMWVQVGAVRGIMKASYDVVWRAIWRDFMRDEVFV